MIKGLLHTLANPARLATRLKLERDLWAFKREVRGLLDTPPAPAGAPRALIVGLHNFIPSAKEDGLYAKMLEGHGYEPHVLVEPGLAARYSSALGLTHQVSFERYRDAAAFEACKTLAHEVVGGAKRISQLVAYQYRGVHVGRHALSLLMRQTHAGTLDPADPVIAVPLTALLAEAMAAVHAAEALLDDVKPALVLFNERGYTPLGEIFDVALARGLNVIQYVASHRDDARIFKRYTSETHDLHPHGLSDEGWARVRAQPWGPEREAAALTELHGHYEAGTWYNFQRLQHGKRIKTRQDVVAQMGLDPSKKIAVIYAHIFWDATFFYGTSLFEDYEEWFVESVRAACANPSINWLVKLHPVNTWRLEADGYKGELAEVRALRRSVGELPSHVRVLSPETDINTYTLFEAADFGLTVRGTVGIEMAVFGRQVLTAGTGRYSGLGFTNDFTSRQDYLEAIRVLQDMPSLSASQVELARRYAHALLLQRPLPLKAFTPHYDSGPAAYLPLNGSPVLNCRTADAFRNSPDMQALAHWMLQEKTLEFLCAAS